MPVSDRTNDFQQLVEEKKHTLPEAKRRRILKATNGGQDGQVLLSKEYVAEAYVILNHINTLTSMLANIRKPYLNTDTRNPSLSSQSRRAVDLDASDQSWSEVRHLSNAERDKIDMQSRVILSQCADRVKELETLERRRMELFASNTNLFTRFLPPRLKPDVSSVSSDVIAAHHSGITWYLSRRLAEASQTQKEMQEKRVKRQLERTKTLGSGAAQEALGIGVGQPPIVAAQPKNSASDRWLEGASSTFTSSLAATLGAPSLNEPRTSKISRELSIPSDDEDDEIELSASQIQQFEMENSNILRAVQDTLESVQQAESRLLDISALQMELVTHLTRQTELTDQLFEDAIATTSMVEKGNLQLREAKRRAKDSRMFILLFLIGASLSLLFLHNY